MKNFKRHPKMRLVSAVGIGLIVAVVIAGVTVTALAPGSSKASSTEKESVASAPLPTPTPPSNADRPIVDDERHLEEQALFAEYEEKLAQVITEEEMWALELEFSNELESRGLGSMGFWGGPLTGGTEVTIAGKKIRLPDDAQLDGVVVSVLPAISLDDGGCAICDRLDDLPWLNIVRGDSKITVGLNTGVVVGGRIAPGEEEAFDFLKEALPEMADAIDSLPITEVSG